MQVVFEVYNQVLGRERFITQPGGATGLAAPALGAYVNVQELLPGELVHPGDSELFRLFQVDGVQGAPGFEGAQEDVEHGGENMEVLREREVNQKHQQGG